MSQPQSPVTNTNSGMTVELNGVPPSGGYALSGRIMLAAIVMLFAVVVLMICLHIYARWYLQRARRLHQLRRRSRRSNRTQLVFYSEPNSAASRGLDAAVLASLPVFLYSPKTLPHVVECAVCLSEFEEKDKLRVLPKCNHGFHLECIDMWFHSHSTCPLCRSPVEPVIESRDWVISVGEPSDAGRTSPGSSSGLCESCQDREHGFSPRNRSNQQTQDGSQTQQLAGRRKGIELERVRIEVPRRNESVDELRLSSPSSQGLRSPMAARLMSLKRILSLNTIGGGISPSSSGVGTCGGGGLDVECGKDESTQGRSRVQTPR